MRALAERYRELGFRVIEGGGTEELILRSTGLAWAVAKRHDHVLGDLREERQKIDAPNLGARFDEHVRATKYRSPRTGKDYDCFHLTQTGVLIVGAKYDATLRLLLALLFNAVSIGNEAEADSFVRQITARLREIRGKARQADLFDTPTSVPEVPPSPVSERRWVDAEEPYDYRYKPTGNDAWDEIYKNGKRYLASARFWPSDNLLHVSVRFAHLHGGYKPRAWLVPSEPQAYLTWDMGKTPRPILVKVLKRFGLYSDLVRDTLDGMFFDDIREKPTGLRTGNDRASLASQN